ncbi:MAG: hypothetical protein WBA41_16470 [Rivularia sp. (in: cyanobacteria)]
MVRDAITFIATYNIYKSVTHPTIKTTDCVDGNITIFNYFNLPKITMVRDAISVIATYNIYKSVTHPTIFIILSKLESTNDLDGKRANFNYSNLPKITMVRDATSLIATYNFSKSVTHPTIFPYLLKL